MAGCYCTGACRNSTGGCPNLMIWRQTPPYHPRPILPDDYSFPPTIKSGWKCPECGSVNAPFVLQCPCSKKESEPTEGG